jgi:hypothetical protein
MRPKRWRNFLPRSQQTHKTNNWTGRETRNGNRCDETNKHGNTKPSSNENHAAQPVNDHRASAHFTMMTKPSEILFDGKPENWPEFEHHLLNKSEKPTIGWNPELLNFQLMYTTTKPFNFL